MLLLLTSVLHFFSLHILPIASCACVTSSAQITFAPRAVITDSNNSSCLSNVAIAFHFAFFAFSRASSTSMNCCFPFGTTALYLPILKLILRRCSRSAALIVLLAKNCSCVSFTLLS